MLRVLRVPVTAALLAAAAQPLLTLPTSLAESSGLATSSVSDDWFFTHEDSGSPAQFHAVAVDGRLLATYRLPGVQARDWEDMARGPDDRGRSSLFLADIGDNSAARDRGILVHRVPEPPVEAAAAGRVVDTPPPVSFRLRYAGAPRDAETLLVHPVTGRLYVVSKGLVGSARMSVAPERLVPDAPNILEDVGSVPTERTGTPGGPGIGSLANRLVTAGDISPDGTRLALRTYTDLYEWRIDADGDVAAALDADPVVQALPPTVQGEGLAYTRDGTALLTTTEGAPAAVHRVPSALPPKTGTSDAGPVAAVRERAAEVVVAGAAAGVLALLVARRSLRRRRRAPR